jgi:hypothetical protein
VLIYDLATFVEMVVVWNKLEEEVEEEVEEEEEGEDGDENENEDEDAILVEMQSWEEDALIHSWNNYKHYCFGHHFCDVKN